MTRIMKYELQRLLFNKFYICLFIFNGLFAWYTLSTDTIAGVAYTAPFSRWSFGAYLASVMPMSILTVLFLLTFFYSKNEKHVEALTLATPVDTACYTLIRIVVVTFGFLILCILALGMSFCFYAAYFNYWNFSVFIVPAIVCILPCFVFAVGVGQWAGRIHIGLLYALMLISLAMSFIFPVGLEGQTPGAELVQQVLSALDFFGKGFYSSSPFLVQVDIYGEPVFVFSAAFLAGRMSYFVIGAVLLVTGAFRKHNTSI